MSENRNTSPDRVASGDIVERLRSLRYVHVPVASQLMKEAAAEIERLRNGAVDARETVCPHVRGTVTQYCSLNFTLAEEERDAIAIVADWADDHLGEDDPGVVAIRKLLERIK